jgi:hypothetical protein
MRQAGVMPQLPAPFRAAVGLIAYLADEARNFPDRAIEVPMLAVSTALQMSLRAQQRYARLTARGDEVLNRSPITDEPPSWATFDAPVAVDSPAVHEAAAAHEATTAEGAARNGRSLRSPKPPPAGGASPATRPPGGKPAAAKTVRSPRNAPPSAFDAVGDD